MKYRNNANPVAIEKAVLALLQGHYTGKQVCFSALAIAASRRTMCSTSFLLGIHTVAYSDGPMQVISVTLTGPGNSVVVISSSGRTR